MDTWERDSKVFWGLAAASCAHVVEEYLWPGGFLESAKKVAPQAFEHASFPIVFGVNAAMVTGCLYGALMRRKNPVHGLAMASLLFTNSLLHLGASLRLREYVPGLVTGLCLYIPLSAKAFSAYRRSEGYRRSGAAGAALLGLVYHSIPFLAFAVRRALAGRREGSSGGDR